MENAWTQLIWFKSYRFLYDSFCVRVHACLSRMDLDLRRDFVRVDEGLVAISNESNEGIRLRALIATPAIGGTHPSSFPAEYHYSRDRKSRVRNQAAPYARHSRHVNHNSYARRMRERPSIFNWILIGRDYSRALGSIPEVRLIIQLSESIRKWR